MAMAGLTHVHSSSDEDLRLRKTGRRVCVCGGWVTLQLGLGLAEQERLKGYFSEGVTLHALLV